MKKHCIKSVVAAFLGILFFQPAEAQLGKLIDKAAEKTFGSPESDAKKAFEPSKKELKALEEDAKDPFLEKQVFKKDGPSGIYYLSVPVGLKSINGEKLYAVKKVYLEFDETNFKVKLYTRYHFGKNGGEAVDPVGWVSSGINLKAKELLMKQMKAKGIVHYREGYFPDFEYVQFRSKNPADGVKKGQIHGLVQLEPGLFYVGDEPYAASGGEPYGHNLFNQQAYLFLYKEGMQEKIKEYNADRIKQFFAAMEKKKEEAYTAGNALPQKANPVKAPSQKAMMDAVQKRVKDYEWKDVPVYCYPTSEWLPQFKEIENSQGHYVKTLTSRVMAIVAVFKKPDGSCGFMKMQIEQLNSYSAPGSLIENYITPPTDHANSGMEAIPCDKANANKPR